MHKIIEVVFNGKVSSFTVTRIDRSKLYGSKKRIAVDTQGQECSAAALTRDGKYILPTGGMAILYLIDEGDVVERNQLRAVDPGENNGNSEELFPNEAMELGPAISAIELLQYTITRVYGLETLSLMPELEALLVAGTIFCIVAPNFTERNSCRSFLLINDTGCFLLLGKQSDFDFVGLEEVDLSAIDIDGVEDDIGDSLDFNIL